MKPLSRYTIVFISIFCLLLPKKITRACGWWVEPQEYRFYLMQPDIDGKDDLRPLFLGCYNPDDNTLKAAASEVDDRNVEEWSIQINGAASKKDISGILYDTPPAVMMQKLDDLRKNNSFLAHLSRPGNEALYRYLVLCKKAEALTTHPDAWEERPAADPLIGEIIKSADSLYSNCKSEFVRLRSAYQLVRMYRYSQQHREAIKIYDSLVAPIKTNSWIKSAALYEKAGLMNGAERDYLFSKVFDMGYRRGYCAFYFRADSLQKILPYARNNHERVVLNALKTLNYRGRSMQQIMRIYSMEPGYDQLPFLLIREINKIEDWLVTSRVTTYGSALKEAYNYSDDYNYAQDKKYAGEFYTMISKMIRGKKVDNPALLELLASHLMLVLKDYESSMQHLAAAKKYPGLAAEMQLQIKVNELLLYTLTQKRFDTKAENMLVELGNLPDAQFPAHFPGLLKDQLTLFIGKTLMQRGELVKGIMILGRTRRAYGDLQPVSSYEHVFIDLGELASPAQYDSILAILDKKNKTPFETYISQPPAHHSVYGEGYPWGDTDFERGWDRHRILDLKASWYIRNDSLQKALKIMEQIPDSFYRQMAFDYYINSDPFTVDVANGHKNEKYEQSCSKREVLQEMIRLQKIASEDTSKAALCYIQLGNAHFNMTWHGKNWLLVKQWWSRYNFNAEDVKRNSFNDNYYGCARARDYYLKALKLSKDKKMASLSCFLAGKCQQNYRDYLSLTRYIENDEKYPNPYISLLKKKGFDTDYLNDMIKECATYDLFRAEVRRMQP